MKILFSFIYALILMMQTGIMYSWSVLSRPIQKELAFISESSFSFVFTLTMFSFCLGGYFTGKMKKKKDPNLPLKMAILLLPTGFLLTSLAQNLFLIVAGFGLLTGFSVGIVYAHILSHFSGRFPNKMGLISGVLLFGFGMGSFLLGPLYSRFIEKGISWRPLFQMYALLLFAVLLFAPYLIGDEKGSSNEIKGISILKVPLFRLYFLWALLYSALGIGLISQGAPIILELFPQMDLAKSALFVGLISLTNGVGRIFIGWIFDRKGPLLPMHIVAFSCLISFFLLRFSLDKKEEILLLIAFLLIGLFYGGVPATNAPFVRQQFGGENYPIHLSLLNLNLLPASFGAFFAGSIKENFGGYPALFLLGILSALVGFLLLFLIKRELVQFKN